MVPPGLSSRPTPANSLSTASHETICIVLIHTTAGASATGQWSEKRSSASGSRRLASPASSRQAEMPGRLSATSVGSHSTCGKPRAKCTACWPPPPPLPAPPAGLEHQAGNRENLAQYRQNRLLVALAGWRRLFHLSCYGGLLCPPRQSTRSPHALSENPDESRGG